MLFYRYLEFIRRYKNEKESFCKNFKDGCRKGCEGINRKCVAVYHEIDAPEKAKKFRKF